MTKYFSPSAPAFYDDTLSAAATLPADAAPITDADWSALLAAQASGEIIAPDANGQPVAAPPPPPPLAETQANALRIIDAAAEAARQAYVTPGAGQAMSYREKAAQATACLATYTAGAPPAAGTYRLLDSEVGIRKNADGTLTSDAYQVAAVVDAARQSWITSEAAINAVRVKAKADIKNATTTAEIDTIMAAIVWP